MAYPWARSGSRSSRREARSPLQLGAAKGLGIDEVFQFELVHAAQEVLAQQGALLLGGDDQIVHGLVEHIQPGADDALFQQAGQLFAAAELGGFLGIPDAAHLVQNEHGALRWSSRVAGFRVADAVVFVHGFGHQAGVQLGRSASVAFSSAVRCLPRAFFRAARRASAVSSVLPNSTSRAGKGNLFQCAVPPLGEQVEGGQRVYLVVPVFHTGRLAHIRGIDVHDVAADAELAGAVHLTAAHIPGGKQPGHQRFAVVHHAGLEGEGVFQEFVAGHRVLQQGFGRDAHGLQPPARQCTQHRKAAILVFAPGTLHRAQHEVPGWNTAAARPSALRSSAKWVASASPGVTMQSTRPRSFCKAAYSSARPAGAGRTGLPAPGCQSWRRSFDIPGWPWSKAFVHGVA